MENIRTLQQTDFEYLLRMIGGQISKVDTYMRKSISAQDRLAVTLRYLATGDSYASLQYTFRISKQAISIIVPTVCEAIIGALKDNIKVRFFSSLIMNFLFRLYNIGRYLKFMRMDGIQSLNLC